MKTEKILLWEQEEYSYPMAFGFVPNLWMYLHEDDKVRPCMIVVPGGGYCVVSPTEGEIVAKKFYERGYNAFVLTYTTNLLMAAPLNDQPMRDLSRAIRVIRKSAAAYRINPQKLVICGFSAGAHLCGSICVHWRDVKEENPAYSDVQNRPDAAILSYPVITSGEKAHRDSFIALLGAGEAMPEGESTGENGPNRLEYFSLEKQVSSDTPPCFLWQTATDELVPVENSYLFAEKCKEKDVPFAHHVFSKGQHGLSLANEAWARGEYGELYTMEQTFGIIAAVKDGTLPVSKEAKDALLAQFDFAGVGNTDAAVILQNEPNDEVAVWPELADAWLKTVLP